MRAVPALALIVCSAGLLGAGQEQKSGLDLTTLDRSVRPQDDLYRFANGAWLDQPRIPDDRVTYGSFAELADRAEHDLRAVIEGLTGRNRAERQIQDLYASVMDVAGIEARGIAPLQPQLQRLRAIDTITKLADEAGRLSAIGAGGPFAASIGISARNPQQLVVEVTQGGILLPDREYYLKIDAASQALRDAYVGYLATLFRLTGMPGGDALARDVLQLETAIARAQQPSAQARVALADDRGLTLDQMRHRMPGFDWYAWARPQGIEHASTIVLGQPEFFTAFSALTQTTALPVWKAWLTSRYLTAVAPYVTTALSGARFEFFGRILTGQQAPRARWKQGVALVSIHLGDALGRLYVEKHFPGPSRARVQKLVGHILNAYRQAVTESDWMTPPARQVALRKLNALRTRVGYPDRWRDYSGLTIRRDDLLGNVQRAQAFDNSYRLQRATTATEPDQWLITPQTVNASYLPWRNEMLLPAAILQPPFFDPAADDAVNYGGIGAVVGHEIQHAFDQRGRQFDSYGTARDWWTAKDNAAFRQREQLLIEQYNRYTPMPGVVVDGQATVGENAGDVGGLAVAMRAYRLALKNAPAPVIDGFSGEQRLLIRWAQIWRTQTREEYQRQTVLIHQHAPAPYRANGAVRNLDAFYEAFAVQPGDTLYLGPEKRVRIW
jgi:putative endopeptidase